MHIYALSYENPWDPRQLLVLFVAARQLMPPDEALARAVEAVAEDGLGNEWVEAVAESTVAGPLVIEGRLVQPSIAIVLD